eukprot:PhF_6_TR38578/c0_g1_i1/m.57288
MQGRPKHSIRGLGCKNVRWASVVAKKRAPIVQGKAVNLLSSVTKSCFTFVCRNRELLLGSTIAYASGTWMKTGFNFGTTVTSRTPSWPVRGSSTQDQSRV